MHIFEAIFFASTGTYAVFRFFRELGAFGLLLLGALDSSSFFFLPFGNDLLLIALISSERSRTDWILYVLMSTLGSLIGVSVIVWLMRKVGEEGLERFVSAKRIEQLKAKFEKQAGWVIFLATLIPPPFPFTAVVMTAAALQVSSRKLLITVGSGRLVRFTIEALLAIYFGRKMIKYMRSDLLAYLAYGFIIMAVVGSIISLRKWMRGRGTAKRLEVSPHHG